MGRTFTSLDLIQLPRLSAAEAAVLMTELLTAAGAETEKHALPPPIERSGKRLSAAHVSLEEVVSPQIGGDTQAKRRADRVIDNAWSATFDWLSGWRKLPAEKNAHLPRTIELFDLVFPSALAFTKLPYKIEWQQSKLRLDAIDREGHDKTFKALGGAAFLAHITEAHAAYGAALHVTVPKPEETPADIRARLDAALAAIRDYATRAAAHADPDVKGSEALSAALLKPLVEWESRATAPEAGDAAPAAPDAGAAAPAETPKIV